MMKRDLIRKETIRFQGEQIQILNASKFFPF